MMVCGICRHQEVRQRAGCSESKRMSLRPTVATVINAINKAWWAISDGHGENTQRNGPADVCPTQGMDGNLVGHQDSLNDGLNPL